MSSNKNTKKNETSSITNKQHFIVILQLLFCALLWGGTFVSSRIGTVMASPYLFGFLRFTASFLFLVIILEFTHHSFFATKLTKKELFAFFILGFTGVFLYNVALLESLRYVSASRASLIINNYPIFTAIGAFIIFKEYLNKYQILGVIISVCGAITVISHGEIQEIFTHVSMADCILFISVASWTIYALLGKVLLSSKSPILIVAWSTFFGTICFGLMSFHEFSTILELPNAIWIHVFYLGIFGNAIACILFYNGIKQIGATKASVFSSLVPAFTVVLGIIFLNEDISTSMIIGGSMSLCGVYLTNRKSV